MIWDLDDGIGPSKDRGHDGLDINSPETQKSVLREKEAIYVTSSNLGLDPQVGRSSTVRLLLLRRD